MNDALPDSDPPSPCTGVCTIDPASEICAGCARTLEEIGDWFTMDAPGKLAVWARIRARRA